MLPEIKLRDITAEDVDRVAVWLEDEEVADLVRYLRSLGQP